MLLTESTQLFGLQSGLPESGGWPREVWIQNGKTEFKRLRTLLEIPVCLPFRNRIMAVEKCLCVVVERSSSDVPDTADRALTVLNGTLSYCHTIFTNNSDPLIFKNAFNDLCEYLENVLLCQICNIPLLISENTANVHANKRLKSNDDNVINNDCVDNDDFQRVQGRKTARKSTLVNISNSVPVCNQFENLTEVMDVSNTCSITDTVNSDSKKSDVTDGNNSASANANVNSVVNSGNNTDNSEKVRPEPIFLKMVENWREIYNDISKRVGFEPKKKVNGDLLKIFPGTIDAYRIIQKYLSDNEHQFFGLRLKSERPRKIIIRGLPVDTPIEDVKTELLTRNFEVHRVSQMKNFQTKDKYPMFLCDLYVNDAFKGIFDISEFMGFFVKVTTYKFKGIKQCFKCQRYNHTSEICSLDPACVKCAGNHLSKNCTITKTEDLKCVNCSGNHTANFSKCPKNPKNFNSEDKPVTFQTATTNPNVSYSQAAGNSAPKPANSRDNRRKNQTNPKTFYHSSNANSVAINPPKTLDSKATTLLGSDSAAQPQVTSNALATFSDTSSLDTTVNKLTQILNLLNQIAAVSNSLKDNPILKEVMASGFLNVQASCLNNVAQISSHNAVVQTSQNQLPPPALP